MSGDLSADDAKWQNEFELAQHNQLANVRGVAEKWSAGIAAIIGAFSAISVIIVPSKLSDLHYGWTKWSVFAAAVIAGGCGVFALLKANTATYGTPRVDADATWETYKSKVIQLAASSAQALRCSRHWTAAALVAIAIGALISQLDGLIYKPGTPAVYVLVTSPSGPAACGALQGTGPQAKVGGTLVTAASTVTVVGHC
jgi:hypothetical protein